MLNLVEARELVAGRIAAANTNLCAGDEFVIIDESTIERPWGWVFFYTSRLWLETRELRYALAGNAPYLVERTTGRVLGLGTAQPTEHYIEAYERTGDPHRA